MFEFWFIRNLKLTVGIVSELSEMYREEFLFYCQEP